MELPPLNALSPRVTDQNIFTPVLKQTNSKVKQKKNPSLFTMANWLTLGKVFAVGLLVLKGATVLWGLKEGGPLQIVQKSSLPLQKGIDTGSVIDLSSFKASSFEKDPKVSRNLNLIEEETDRFASLASSARKTVLISALNDFQQSYDPNLVEKMRLVIADAIHLNFNLELIEFELQKIVEVKIQEEFLGLLKQLFETGHGKNLLEKWIVIALNSSSDPVFETAKAVIAVAIDAQFCSDKVLEAVKMELRKETNLEIFRLWLRKVSKTPEEVLKVLDVSKHNQGRLPLALLLITESQSEDLSVAEIARKVLENAFNANFFTGLESTLVALFDNQHSSPTSSQLIFVKELFKRGEGLEILDYALSTRNLPILQKAIDQGFHVDKIEKSIMPLVARVFPRLEEDQQIEEDQQRFLLEILKLLFTHAKGKDLLMQAMMKDTKPIIEEAIEANFCIPEIEAHLANWELFKFYKKQFQSSKGKPLLTKALWDYKESATSSVSYRAMEIIRCAIKSKFSLELIEEELIEILKENRTRLASLQFFPWLMDSLIWKKRGIKILPVLLQMAEEEPDNERLHELIRRIDYDLADFLGTEYLDNGIDYSQLAKILFESGKGMNLLAQAVRNLQNYAKRPSCRNLLSCRNHSLGIVKNSKSLPLNMVKDLPSPYLLNSEKGDIFEELPLMFGGPSFTEQVLALLRGKDLWSTDNE